MRDRLQQTVLALRGNQGSGIVVVVITMLFVSLLGAALLYTSYTCYLVKITDRAGKENFYDASTAMDQVTAGVQEKVSDAIANAYTYVLTNYSTVDPKTTFEEKFREELLDCEYVGDDLALHDLIYRLSSDYRYSPKGLLSFVKAPTGAGVNINGCTGGGGGTETPGSVEVEITADGATVTLQNVSLTYQDNGYETNVTTDIAIDMPDFYQSAAEYTVSGLPEYTLVAKNELCSYNSNIIDGSVYAGKVNVVAHTLSLSNGTLISPGPINLSDGGVGFSTAAECSVWAKDLRVGSNGAMTLNGKAYIADDLELNKNSQAVLGCDYYGFGMSEDDPNASSAILANGTSAGLNLINANKLFLAGNSFISGNADILMGESVSAKTNQLVYLIPETSLTGGEVTSNPQVFTKAQITEANGSIKDLTANVQLAAELITQGVMVQQLVYPLSSDKYVVYLFIKFGTVEQANTYFAQYFTEHQTEIATYLENYLSISGKAALTQSRGNSIEKSGSTLELQEPVTTDTLRATANRLAGFYKNLCINLTTTDSGALASITNPYDYYVNAERVRSLTAGDSGTVSVGGASYFWLVTPDGYTVNSGCPYSVIIADGPVVVAADYQGLILCGSTIEMRANVTAGIHTDEILRDVGDYLAGYSSVTNDDGTKESWNLHKLVYYRKWTKQ